MIAEQDPDNRIKKDAIPKDVAFAAARDWDVIAKDMIRYLHDGLDYGQDGPKHKC
jgi:hypothetical protein